MTKDKCEALLSHLVSEAKNSKSADATVGGRRYDLHDASEVAGWLAKSQSAMGAALLKGHSRSLRDLACLVA